MIDIDRLCSFIEEGFRSGDPVFGGIQDDEGIIVFHVSNESGADHICVRNIAGELIPERFKKHIDPGLGHGLLQKQSKSHAGTGTVSVRVLVPTDAYRLAALQFI